jgi:hypothetical protein
LTSCKMCSGKGRCAGSICSIACMHEQVSAPYTVSSRASWAMDPNDPRNSNCALGALRVMRCRRMTPILHTSALVLYGCSLNTSGACAEYAPVSAFYYFNIAECLGIRTRNSTRFFCFHSPCIVGFQSALL